MVASMWPRRPWTLETARCLMVKSTSLCAASDFQVEVCAKATEAARTSEAAEASFRNFMGDPFSSYRVSSYREPELLRRDCRVKVGGLGEYSSRQFRAACIKMRRSNS